MKATGIVRRIDDLGRIVIPKEIRSTLRIREGDPLEIFVDEGGEVILKKYSPISELGSFAKEYAETLFESLNHIVLIADRNTYIAVGGRSKKDYANKEIGEAIESAICGRQSIVQTTEGEYNIVGNSTEKVTAFIIAPIIANSDQVGAIVMLSKSERTMGEVEQKLTETAAGFFAKQMEQ
ncbi:stage V sporulation protein T [Bacillaceae bacterium IKA-2]|nr:stage V sporulation protein T [Bacillaceae bacterium IKA-2]